MTFQIARAPRTDPLLILPTKRLRDGAEELLRARDSHVGAEVSIGVEHGLVDPLGQLAALPLEAAVRQHHDAVVVLAAQHATQALRGVAHGVEGQEVVFADAVRFAQELEAGFEDARFGVLEGDADAEHGAAVVVVEIDSFGDFAARDAEEDGAAAVAAGGAVRFEREGGFLRVRGFDEDEFEFPDFVEDAHALPHADDGFHVEVGGEKHDDAVGGEFGKGQEERAVVADDAGFVADLEAGGDGGLIASAGHDHRQEGPPRKSHAVGFLDHGREAEHLGVHF